MLQVWVRRWFVAGYAMGSELSWNQVAAQRISVCQIVNQISDIWPFDACWGSYPAFAVKPGPKKAFED